MKRIATAVAAALTLMGGLAATSEASAAPLAHQRVEANRNANFHQWRRGERLTRVDMQRYRQVDFRREHLRAPPRGYHYVRDERGDTLLVGIATGAILSVILAH